MHMLAEELAHELTLHRERIVLEEKSSIQHIFLPSWKLKVFMLIESSNQDKCHHHSKMMSLVQSLVSKLFFFFSGVV